MIEELKSLLITKVLTLYNSRITTRFQSMAMFFIVGLFVTILISIFPTTLAFSIYNSAINTTASDSTNRSSLSMPISSNIYSEPIPPKVKEIIINEVINKSKAAIVVGLINPNGIKVFSFGNISKENNVPVNYNTLFNIDSVTKTFTTLVLADMVKQGIVSLNDPIEKYLPSNVTVPQYYGTKITLENLATHTSGLPFMPSNIWVNKTLGTINPNYNSTLLYEGLSNTILLSKPDTKFLYSDFGMGLLGHILSLKEGVSYEQLVKGRILDVLGMEDTKIDLSQNDIKYRFPVGHLNGSEIQTPKIPSVITGAGGLHSTANDLLKYLSANLGLIHTKLDDSIALQHLIQHPSVLPNPMNYSAYIALGWAVLTDHGTETITHTGSINGWNANVAFIPAKQIGVVSICSCDLSIMDTGALDFVLLNITGMDSLSAYN